LKTANSKGKMIVLNKNYLKIGYKAHVDLVIAESSIFHLYQ